MYFAIHKKKKKKLHVRWLECVLVANASLDGHAGKSNNEWLLLLMNRNLTV